MERETFEGWADWFARHKGKALGTAAGFAFAVVVLRYGLIAALFVALCMAVGYLLGSGEDGRGRLRQWLLRVFGWLDAARAALRRGRMR